MMIDEEKAADQFARMLDAAARGDVVIVRRPNGEAFMVTRFQASNETCQVTDDHESMPLKPDDATIPTMEELQRTRGFGALRGKIWMADDFNAPLEDFKDEL